MPHLTVEYSSNIAGLPEAEMLAALNATLCASPEIALEVDLKSRIWPVAQYQIGTASAPRAFVHAQLRLLSGRTPEAKKDLSERIASVLQRLTPQPAGVQVQLSVEITDMDRPSYFKGVL